MPGNGLRSRPTRKPGALSNLPSSSSRYSSMSDVTPTDTPSRIVSLPQVSTDAIPSPNGSSNSSQCPPSINSGSSSSLRGKRGPNRNIGLEQKKRKGEAITVDIPKEVGRAVGKGQNEFSREISIILKQFAPIRVESWGKISPEVKHTIYVRVANRSKQNSGNRARLPEVHRMVSKPFAQHKHELMNGVTNHPRSPIEFFESCYNFDSKGWAGPISEAKHAKMVELRNEAIAEEIEQGERENGSQIEPRRSDESIVEEVCGRKSGYVKGQGRGPKPPSRLRNLSSACSSSQAQFQSVIETQQTQLSAQQEKIESQQAKISGLEKQIDYLMEFAKRFMSEENVASAE